ncbi:MAG: D-alanyl-D-alanine carboxypeptidase [Clostridiales bacterium]|jgi:D-alanyl-D-alanine carboxypeptidase (penicillin-binding protein 5/6)|nr:D-alanyl-D-alanine carboxypeptidase [Clostridiales bacterium]
MNGKIWKKSLSRGFWALLLLVMLFGISTVPVWAEEFVIKGESAVLMDGSSGSILFEQNADKKWYPASVTKIMTLVLVLEALESGKIKLDDKVTTSAEAAGMGGSQVYLYEGETRTVDEMLVAVAVGSGNDASVAIAEHVGGSLAGFVDMMNEKAAKLGMSGSHFVNPHGLHDPDHYVTARDMVILARHATAVPRLLDYTSIYEYDFRPEPKPLKLWNTNRLLRWFDNCDGLKTGYTPEAKRNLVSTAKRDGMRLISVVLGVEEAKGHFNESMRLLNYGFNKYAFQVVYEKGQDLGQVKVSKGVVDAIPLILTEDVGMVIEKGSGGDIETRVDAPAILKAPLKKGDVAGTLIILREGIEMQRVDILIQEDIPKSGFWRIVGKVFRAAGF